LLDKVENTEKPDAPDPLSHRTKGRLASAAYWFSTLDRTWTCNLLVRNSGLTGLPTANDLRSLRVHRPNTLRSRVGSV